MTNKKLSKRRLIENEVIFRSVNQNIQEFMDEKTNSTGLMPFYCECSEPNCVERIEMTTEEYAKIHENKKWFITKPKHQFFMIEKVIKKTQNYQIVEKYFTPPSQESIDTALKAIEI